MDMKLILKALSSEKRTLLFHLFQCENPEGDSAASGGGASGERSKVLSEEKEIAQESLTCEPWRQRQERKVEKQEEKEKGEILDVKGQERNGQKSKKPEG